MERLHPAVSLSVLAGLILVAGILGCSGSTDPAPTGTLSIVFDFAPPSGSYSGSEGPIAVAALNDTALVHLFIIEAGGDTTQTLSEFFPPGAEEARMTLEDLPAGDPIDVAVRIDTGGRQIPAVPYPSSAAFVPTFSGRVDNVVLSPGLVTPIAVPLYPLGQAFILEIDGEGARSAEGPKGEPMTIVPVLMNHSIPAYGVGFTILFPDTMVYPDTIAVNPDIKPDVNLQYSVYFGDGGGGYLQVDVWTIKGGSEDIVPFLDKPLVEIHFVNNPRHTGSDPLSLFFDAANAYDSGEGSFIPYVIDAKIPFPVP